MNREVSVLIKLIKSAIRGEKQFDAPDADYEELLRIAKANSVANTIAFVLGEAEKVPLEIREAANKELYYTLWKRTKEIVFLPAVINALEENRIKCVFLKGQIVKDLYPSPDMRSMSDIDVFAEKDDMEKIRSIMVKLGYSEGAIDSGNHFEFMKDKSFKIEFHPELVSLDSRYAREVFLKKTTDRKTVAEAMDVWSHTEPYNNEYVRSLTVEYHYVYIIMHIMNHYLTAGTGIRSIMDVWIMNRTYCKTWDRKKIDELLERFGLTKFEQYAVATADRWFDLSDCGYEQATIDAELLDTFEEYIYTSGTYGNIENAAVYSMNYDINRTQKVTYFINRLFPPVVIMQERYPVLEKAPVLLPVMWCVRIAQTIFGKHKSRIKKEYTTVIHKTFDKKDEQRKQLLDELLP